MNEIVRLLKSAAVVILCMVSALLVLLFSWLPKGGVYPFVSQKMWGPGLLWLAGAKMEVSGLENLKKGVHYIYYANHQSYYDIPALCAAVPAPLYFIAKHEILKVPVFGWGMYAIGMVFVDRTNPEKARASMAKAAKGIKKGKSILAFPEGTRTKTGRLQPFKKGIFHVAKKGNIPMVPVAIHGSSEVLPLSGRLASGRIRVVVGTPIPGDEVESMAIGDLTHTAHDALSKLLMESSSEVLSENSSGSAFRESEQTA